MFRLIGIVIGLTMLFIGLHGLTEEINNAVNLQKNIEVILNQGEGRE